MMQKEAANSIITVDLKQIKKNIESIKNYLAPGTELMITVKSNGYGHGLVKPACYIRNNCGIDKFATSMVSEAVELREAGINCFMMVLGGIPYEAVPIVAEYDLVVPAYDPVFLSLLSDEAVKQRKTVKAHIKIDTGLRRLGVRLGAQLDELVEHVKTLPGIKIEGAYTHLANPNEEDQTITNKQLKEFNAALSQIEAKGITLKYKHVANSDALVRNRATHYNLVRPAALWLGYDPTGTLDVQPAITWKTFVSNVLMAEKGESISYFGSCIMKKRTKVAVLGFGAGDGYVRHLVTPEPEKNGVVLIHGQKVPLLSMNMDQAFADVTDIDDVKINDEVYLLGRMGDEQITMDELGRIAGTSTGHIQCSLGSRPMRIYLE